MRDLRTEFDHSAVNSDQQTGHGQDSGETPNRLRVESGASVAESSVVWFGAGANVPAIMISAAETRCV